MGMTDVSAVCYDDKLYLGGNTSGNHRDDARLYIYSPAINTWETPIDTPVYWFGLVIYHSQLVLIGGMEYNQRKIITSKLWTLSEHDQWQETLPPMLSKRHSVCAVSYGDHLLVAGGKALDGECSNVEVFYGSHWLFAKSLPAGRYNLTSATLDQHWYLTVYEYDRRSEVYYASLDSLLASCQPSETSQPSSVIVWKRLTDAPDWYSSIAVFGGTLISIGGGIRVTSTEVYAYSFQTNSWILIPGDIPFGVSHTCSIVLPTGDLVLLGGKGQMSATINNVLKAAIKGIINFCA